MSKSILVMDTPESCIDCPCHFADDVMVWCGKEKKEISADDIETFKPDWCPLRDFPGKKEENRYHNNYEKGCVDGWNSCIDEILKGANESEI